MNSKDILYSQGKNDEFYTPMYAVKPLIDYLKQNNLINKNQIIWFHLTSQKVILYNT